MPVKGCMPGGKMLNPTLQKRDHIWKLSVGAGGFSSGVKAVSYVATLLGGAGGAGESVNIRGGHLLVVPQ